MPQLDMWLFEKHAYTEGYYRVAGTDEVGRGPLAGPVVSAAVILPKNLNIPEIRDSKKISQYKRDLLYDRIYEEAETIGLGIIDSHEIDRINILQASLAAMCMAVDNLVPSPDFLLIDGKFKIPCTLPQKAVIKGDDRSISIAAASIVAKVTRDRLMEKYGKLYPQYGFAQNKGYPTKSHRSAIKACGCCPIHRMSFKGVKEFSVRNHHQKKCRKSHEKPYQLPIVF
jgi:ribonuclease HII